MFFKSKAFKIALGVATFFPWLSSFLILLLPGLFKGHDQALEVLVNGGLFALVGGYEVLAIVYWIAIFTNDQFDDSTKVVWTLLIEFMGLITMPIYWWVYIWGGFEGKPEYVVVKAAKDDRSVTVAAH